jgi:hypothetical protein
VFEFQPGATGPEFLHEGPSKRRGVFPGALAARELADVICGGGASMESYHIPPISDAVPSCSPQQHSEVLQAHLVTSRA